MCAYSQPPATMITLTLPAPGGEVIQCEYNLHVLDTVIVVNQATNSRKYVYHVVRVANVIKVSCQFYTGTNTTKAEFVIALDTMKGAIIPQTKQKILFVRTNK